MFQLTNASEQSSNYTGFIRTRLEIMETKNMYLCIEIEWKSEE
jgi:hypothetical protein